MWQDKLKEIIYILENSNVNEIEVSFWWKKFRVVKSSSTIMSNNTNSNIEQVQSVPVHSTNQETSSIDEKIKSVTEGEELLSPMPGTFYSSPTPDDPPFVTIGSKVVKGQTLCIIEAMKIMNEIESEIDGTVSEVLIQNSDPIEYNQPLFKIKPI
ncbi:MAG: acetyl-CoA carboxylase biotin carboxyl carrier protein [Candidatus Marinimicrobia bacterium]|jgi:acetyl-CoA carboxylase biotin carboxyl carrier protein|nr:acetyl-CoA carboxylase biotin carboxyl carrier protein [Candidatus Neomarinimicrobiota bacterium]